MIQESVATLCIEQNKIILVKDHLYLVRIYGVGEFVFGGEFSSAYDFEDWSEEARRVIRAKYGGVFCEVHAEAKLFKVKCGNK